MEILLIFPGFILAIIIMLIYEIKLRKLQNKVKPQNIFHFYVARDRAALSKGRLNLWINKPERGVNIWYAGKSLARYIEGGSNLELFGLNPSDYDNLKWEDEPVEVFLKLNN